MKVIDICATLWLSAVGIVFIRHICLWVKFGKIQNKYYYKYLEEMGDSCEDPNPSILRPKSIRANLKFQKHCRQYLDYLVAEKRLKKSFWLWALVGFVGLLAIVLIMFLSAFISGFISGLLNG
ncbi:unnamed protein product [marine sediment metagenome]|uniref:Uncharacterized protein n=1 Tax=marine sediment metagenome TaxID=412755 RepID=X0WSH6_9ZZZZ